MTSSAFTYIYATDVDVTADAIWALYADASSWPRWDAGLDSITRDGAFAAGTTGTMTLVDGPTFRYRLASVTPMREFTDETPVGELVVRVSHRLDPQPDGRLRITYEAQIDGPAEQALEVGPQITGDFPDTVASLVALAGGR